MTQREPLQTPIFRAPMRARLLDAPDGAGADHGLEHGFVGTGDALGAPPDTLDEAVAAAAAAHGDRAARMLRRFAELPDGVVVWTRTGDGAFRLGRIAGPWRYDDSAPAAYEVGNLQRTHGPAAQRRTAELWAAHG
jgi:hypothetical protein